MLLNLNCISSRMASGIVVRKCAVLFRRYTFANEPEAISLNQVDVLKSPGGKGGDNEESKVGREID